MNREGCYGMTAVNPHYKVEWRFESSTVYKLSALIYRDVESRDTVRWVIQHRLNKWARAFEAHTERTFHGWMTDLFSGGDMLARCAVGGILLTWFGYITSASMKYFSCQNHLSQAGNEKLPLCNYVWNQALQKYLRILSFESTTVHYMKCENVKLHKHSNSNRGMKGLNIQPEPAGILQSSFHHLKYVYSLHDIRSCRNLYLWWLLNSFNTLKLESCSLDLSGAE